MATTYAPLRPPTERDTIHLLNGVPVYLGAIVSTGAATSNASTALPFNNTQTSPQSFAGTLAGKVLLVQASASGFILPCATLIPAVATQTTLPPAVGTVPGVQISANTAAVIVMRPDAPFLQFIPATGSANLLVWELT